MLAATATVALPMTAAWVTIEAPARVAPGARFRLEARARNLSAVTWERAGEGRVALDVLVVDQNGNPWPRPPRPTPPAYPVPPGGATTFRVELAAPDIPGRYNVLVGVATIRKGKVTLIDMPPMKSALEVTQ
ncbi:MAG TPA: hypothetical protein VGM37_11195 [Armatimonadota bacterium]